MIQRCRLMVPLRFMCRLLEGSLSGFFARQRRHLGNAGRGFDLPPEVDPIH